MKETTLQGKDKIKPQDKRITVLSSIRCIENVLSILKLWSGVIAQQQQVARGMILKEADTFNTDDTELSDIYTHKMNIQFKDRVPA